MNRDERIEYLTSKGFLPTEARQLSKTSDDGMKSNYFKSMINSRISMYAYAKKQGMSKDEYRQYIKGYYIDNGFIKYDIFGRRYIDVWKLVRHWEDRGRDKGQAYVSPWKNKGWTPKKRRARKGTPRRAIEDRKQLLNSRINVINNQLKLAKGSQREILNSELSRRQKELHSYD
jgi:hypothetical protein